jgi:hypothetical protein
VARSGLVKRGADHFAADRPLHVRHLFGALVGEQHDQGYFRMVGGDGIGDALQQHRFAGARLRYHVTEEMGHHKNN